jgi:hypothetical protein
LLRGPVVYLDRKFSSTVKSDMNNKLFCSLLCLLLASSSAGAQAPTHRAPQAGDPAKQSRIDPCSLLTSAEIAAVQGEPVQQAKPSDQPGTGLLMLQCLFRTTTPTKSVSLAVAAPSAMSPRAFWRKQFHPGQDAAKEKDSARAEKKSVAGRNEQKEQEEEEESTRPRAIAGLGEEAYWVGGPIAGALYVLKGNTFLRISVGGIREEPARIEKSKALARVALKRL